ncbi:hypothetical protein HUU62_04805 [Rhodoferax sp. 4810]|nr:hypothetical protein [Rhodoferax jenense]
MIEMVRKKGGVNEIEGQLARVSHADLGLAQVSSLSLAVLAKVANFSLQNLPLAQRNVGAALYVESFKSEL